MALERASWAVVSPVRERLKLRIDSWLGVDAHSAEPLRADKRR